MTKRILGQYFTTGNPFNNNAFVDWANEADIKKMNILEPFAGNNSLITMLKTMSLCDNFSSFDIEPKHQDVKEKNTLNSFPTGYNVCITNPPYLARNSAKRRGLEYPNTKYDDLYKYSLEKCLDNCEYVGAIIPASFLNSNIFRNRLRYYILLNSKMFNETDHPVCLALFSKEARDTEIYYGQSYIGKLSKLETKLPNPNNYVDMHFNDPIGELGLIAIDNTLEASIRFIDGNEIPAERIDVSSRSITRISISKKFDIDKLNFRLNKFREETHDLFLTPFKGLRKDKMYRRRLDYATARKLISEVIYGL